MNTNLENVLLTVNEVAKTLKTNSNTVYELINRGELRGLKLGRIKAHDIDIDFNDESVSRLQTTIFYDGNNWYICDGDGNKGSLNGTWYFAEDYSTIDEGMIFRAGSTTFISHLFTP